MSFTGKATDHRGDVLPESVEDIGDIVGIVSPYETPLLDHLGDPQRAATSTVHQWLEDQLLPNHDTVDDVSLVDPDGGEWSPCVSVKNVERFRVGDQIQAVDSAEVLFVTAIAENRLSIIRGFGGTTPEPIENHQELLILGNAAIDGDDADNVRFTKRVRKSNYTQLFIAGVEAQGSQMSAGPTALADEMDYQKQERLRELARDLENCVINGVAPKPDNIQASRRTIRGIIPSIETNVVNAEGAELTADILNSSLRTVWERSTGGVDTILVGGLQKRAINGFVMASMGHDQTTRYRGIVSIYESDFGVCRVVLSRWVPADTVVLLDSSRVDVLPLAGRSFHYKPLSPDDDRERGQVIGEYTLELRQEAYHGIINNLKTV